MRLIVPSMMLLCAFLSACSEDFAPASRLVGLRLVAVRADKPAARAGEEVKLSAIYHDAQGRSLSWGYALCDGAASSAALDCLRAMSMDTLSVSRDQPEYSLIMPESKASTTRDAALGVVVIVCPGEIVRGDTHGVPIACELDGKPLGLNDFEMGVKRIFFTARSDSHNPEIRGLRWDGESWPAEEVKQVEACDRDSDELSKCAAGVRHRIEIEAPDAGESFVDVNGTSAHEQVVAQFYGTGGTFEWDVRTIETASTRWVAQRSDRGKTLTLHFVVRDNRGGVSWETRLVEVAP